MAPIEMERPNYRCDLGDNGGRYKTPAMEAEMALQLLTLHNQHHNQNAAGNQSPTSKKPPKYPRPEIGLEETPERWEAFVAAWGQSKLEYDLREDAAARQLYLCCSTDLSTSINRVTGGRQHSLNEATLLARMKELVVPFQNPAVYVHEFLAMMQQPDEGVRHYLSRLKGVASRCEFTTLCTCNEEVSYSDHIVRYKLVSGLVDEEIKEDMLGLENKSLDDTVKAVEAKESAKRARTRLGAKVTSQINKITPNQKHCKCCGKSGHSHENIEERRASCPAYNATCFRCQKKGHFSEQCRKKPKPKNTIQEVGTTSPQGKTSPNVEHSAHSVSAGTTAGLLSIQVASTSSSEAKNMRSVPHLIHEQG